MSSFEDAYDGGHDADLTNAEWFGKVSEMYPCLAKALIGEDDWERDSRKRPSFTMMLSVRSGSLRVTFSNPSRPRMFHCGVSNPGDILWSVEQALKNNQGEWSVRRENGTSGRR